MKWQENHVKTTLRESFLTAERGKLQVKFPLAVNTEAWIKFLHICQNIFSEVSMH